MAAAAAAFSILPSPSAYLLNRRRIRSAAVPIRCFSSPSATPPSTILSQDDLKKLAAVKAVEYVKSDMVLGLGTGSTAAFVVAEIGSLLSSGKLGGIVGVPTSKRTYEQAKSLGIPLSTLDEHPRLDLAIDGADETEDGDFTVAEFEVMELQDATIATQSRVDPELNLVKGRGGALLREKMVEAASDKFVVVVDDTKLVTGLGGSGLAMPVEVVQFCWKYNQTRLQELFVEEGCEAKIRLDADGKPYVTDNSNYIIDLYFKTPIADASAAGKEISSFEGVVEHGLFLDMATAVIIAGKEGVSIKTK
ncbi:putative ribose-5-phosphate isomerase [Platanthera guangdongensis]|uniref:ribose-5-phosphate isomerase n=1 Tax=Platanthera guangdongensis TaxID=2320717 RepID=A0ABR2MX39_9ASPA